MSHLIDIFLHLDKYLSQLVGEYGPWIYGILFLVIFAETGLVVTPFLPGDSLLFAAGAIAATGLLSPHLLFLVLVAAGVLGNTANYSIGHFLGPKVFTEKRKYLKQEYLTKTRTFYEKHGGMAVILGRFLPILRTFVPFVAGIGAMTYARYTVYNVAGSALWVGLFVYAGYFFGNIEFVKKNFSLVILAIILVSAVPIAIEIIRKRRRVK